LVYLYPCVHLPPRSMNGILPSLCRQGERRAEGMPLNIAELQTVIHAQFVNVFGVSPW